MIIGQSSTIHHCSESNKGFEHSHPSGFNLLIKTVQSTFIGFPVWCIENLAYKISSTKSFSIKLTDQKSGEIWEAVDEFINSHGNNLSFSSTSSSSDDSFVDKKVVKKLEKEVSQGVCYGMSVETLHQLSSASSLASDPSEIVNNISTENGILYQALHVMEHDLEACQEIRYSILHNKPLPVPNSDPRLIKIKSELNNPELIRQNYQKCASSLKEIKAVKKKLLSFSLLNQKEFIRPIDHIPEIKKFLTDNTDKIFKVDLAPKNRDGIGHVVIIDLVNNIFFDQDLGYYHYPSHEKCIDAFINCLLKVYPEYHKGELEFFCVSK